MRGLWGIIDRYIHEIIIMGSSGTDGARSPQLLRALLSDTMLTKNKWSTTNGWPFIIPNEEV